MNEPDVLKLLHAAADLEASDVHLVPGHPAAYRIHGNLTPQGAELRANEVARMIEVILPERMRRQNAISICTEMEKATPDGAVPSRAKNLDFSVALEHGGKPRRFRANVFLAQGQWCACLRHVPNEIPTFDWMGFPQDLAERLINYANGLVIITGVTGSGKSTTLAALVNLLNQNGGHRIITVEEPVEYVHHSAHSSLITQREVGRDVDSFYDGLKYGLRQDPDIILIGEIRDRDTAQMALSAAETGHLILTTLHTKDAKGAITRFVDLFPYDAQDDVRTQLALSLRSVVSQHLLPPASGSGKRVLALEVMHVNNPVKAAIKLGKVDSVDSAIQTGKRDGLMSIDEHLRNLVVQKKISLKTARSFAKHPDDIA